MINNEIKKALYKEKPTAETVIKNDSEKHYSAELQDGMIINFDVQFSEMGETEFEDQMPAQLLIRWMRPYRRLYVRLEIQEGEREHTHHCLFTTDIQDDEQAGKAYAESYWDEGGNWDEDRYSAFFGEMAIRVEKVQEITEDEFVFLEETLYSA